MYQLEDFLSLDPLSKRVSSLSSWTRRDLQYKFQFLIPQHPCFGYNVTPLSLNLPHLPSQQARYISCPPLISPPEPPKPPYVNSAHRGTSRSQLDIKDELSPSSKISMPWPKKNYREEAAFIHSRLCESESAQRPLRDVGGCIYRTSFCY